MTKEQIQYCFRSQFHESNLQILLAFLTGSFLGYLLLCYVDCFTTSYLLKLVDLHRLIRSSVVFFGKLLMLVYLSGYLPRGAVFVPPLLGIKGLYLCCMCMIAFRSEPAGVSMVLIGLSLILLVSYSFVLANWSVRRSLVPESDPIRFSRFLVLLFTILMWAIASYLLFLAL